MEALIFLPTSANVSSSACVFTLLRHTEFHGHIISEPPAFCTRKKNILKTKRMGLIPDSEMSAIFINVETNLEKQIKRFQITPLRLFQKL